MTDKNHGNNLEKSAKDSYTKKDNPLNVFNPLLCELENKYPENQNYSQTPQKNNFFNFYNNLSRIFG